jgi:hypothetical protein
MRRALHLSIQKTLGVVRSHYEVNFEAVASGYVVPEGVEDEEAMEQVMRFPLMPPRRSLRTSWSSSSRMLLMSTRPKPEDCWALGPFFVRMLASGLRGCVNKQVNSWNI